LEDGRVTGVRGQVLAPDDSPRGAGSSREVTGEFVEHAAAVLLATGGIGGNEELVRRLWPAELGTMPESFVHGVPASVDGAGMLAAERAGARWIHQDPCGTTPRGSATGTRCGADTASASCPGPPRCGSTPAAGACPP